MMISVDAAVIVITAGANQKPDETRLDLDQKEHAGFMKSIVGEITATGICQGTILDCVESGRHS